MTILNINQSSLNQIKIINHHSMTNIIITIIIIIKITPNVAINLSSMVNSYYHYLIIDQSIIIQNHHQW